MSPLTQMKSASMLSQVLISLLLWHNDTLGQNLFIS